jgi:alpha-galactosidase
MRNQTINHSRSTRREFFRFTAAACLAAPVDLHYPAFNIDSHPSGLDILRRPDSVFAGFSQGPLQSMHFESGAWTLPGYRLTAEPVQSRTRQELPVHLSASAQGLGLIRLRWQGATGDTGLTVGDHWERAYGDLEWRGTIPNRIMPWYFFTQASEWTAGYGVKTQPSAFCFWQRDASGITLTLDLKNGGNSADLKGRDIAICTVVQQITSRDVPFHLASRDFCNRMSPNPLLPRGPIFGANDWNYAYGKNTSSGILRDADLIATLSPSGSIRPHIVIDDGWQDPQRFPDMTHLAEEIKQRNLHPGIWIRPLRAPRNASASLLLSPTRFGNAENHAAPAYDPTIPEALEEISKSIANPVAWNYTFLKHDFSTYELFGRWGSEMGDQISARGWNFHDRTKTNAEIVTALYRSIRNIAGKDITILGCNTVGHLAAGIFESQRIGDDTSGTNWERTRRMGVNALAHRIAQHGTFFHIDPDCVAITKDVGWRETSEWMNLVAQTGTSLFLSPSPDAITLEAKSAMKDAMARVIEQAGAYPRQPTSSTTPEVWVLGPDTAQTRRYDWTVDGASPSIDV